MTNFTERAVPTLTANFLMKEAESRYFFAQKHIHYSERILDLACGTGYGSTIMRSKCEQYVGVDISDEALKYAIKKYSDSKAAFLKMDVNNTIFKDNSFDAIVAFEMIEHLTNPSVFLKEVKRLLSKKGVFVVSTPNRLVQSPQGVLMSPYHTREFSPEEFDTLLRKQFSHVQIFGQRKSKRAIESVNKFMYSQKIRQLLVDIDVIGVRKLFQKDLKERLWKYIGALAGRQAQESVRTSDFVINSRDLTSAEYLIAVCKK